MGSGSSVLPSPSKVFTAKKATKIATAITRHSAEATRLVKHLEDEHQLKNLGLTIYPLELTNAIFVGHLTPDMDSIGGALGAAFLFDGVAVTPGPLNTESQFVLELWGVETPPPVEELLIDKSRSICLVDHNQTTQMHPGVLDQSSRIAGCIDHHALQTHTFQTDSPVYVDVRPWGSMSTIIAHMALALNIRLPVPIAGCLMCAILSDTLNLRSPTTTEWDRKMLTVLSKLCMVDDVDALASRLFRAKSKELMGLSDNALVVGDMKAFSYSAEKGFKGAIGVSVIETTDTQGILSRKDDLLKEMLFVRRDENLQMLLLFAVDIVELHSTLLVCSAAEEYLARTAYGVGAADNGLIDMGKRVSRKMDFVPPISAAVKGGWCPPVEAAELVGAVDDPESVLVMSSDYNGNMVRKSTLKDVDPAEKQRYILNRSTTLQGDMSGEIETPGSKKEQQHLEMRRRMSVGNPMSTRNAKSLGSEPTNKPRASSVVSAARRFTISSRVHDSNGRKNIYGPT